jgi:hypothetical protein
MWKLDVFDQWIIEKVIPLMSSKETPAMIVRRRRLGEERKLLTSRGSG